MKNKIKLMMMTLLMCIVMVPAVKANAAEVSKPTGLAIYGQAATKNDMYFIWNYDEELATYAAYGYGGYEIQFLTTKNKVIKKFDTSSNATVKTGTVGSKEVCLFTTNIGKLRTNAFKMKVRAYTTDENGKKSYTGWLGKVFVPQAKIKGGKCTGASSATINWTKVNGAKSYTVYYKKKSSSKWSKAGTTTKTSINIRNLTKYQNYLVFVKANVQIGKKKVTSTKTKKQDDSSYGFYIYTTYR